MSFVPVHFASIAIASALLCGGTVHAESAAQPSPSPTPASIGGDVYIFVDKMANELTIYSLRDPHRVLQKYRAISGAKPGDKLFEGDLRTPEGIYFLEREVPKTRLRSLHGAAAFELNYPNPFDRIHRRTGHGIWIHGVDREDRLDKRFDTQGCVAVSNLNVVDLRQWIGANRMTPVIIVEEQKAGVPLGVEGSESALGQRVVAWAKAWASKDPEAYLSFYDPSFRGRGMNYDQWAKYKRRLAKAYKKISVNVDDLKIFRHGKYSVALFQQHYKSNRFESNGWKRLYLLGDGADARILAEEMRKETGGANFDEAFGSEPETPAPVASAESSGQ